MALSPVAGQHAPGAVALWVAGERARPTRASELIARARLPGGATHERRASTPRRARPARRRSRRRRTSRSRTAPRCSARWRPSRCACTDYLDAADTHSTLAAVRALGALVEQRGRTRSSSAAPACARRASPIGADRRRQRRARCMRLLPGWLAGPGRAASFTLDGDDVDPPPPGRPHRRAAARDGRRDRGAPTAASPPFTVHGARLRGDRLRPARRQRAGQVVRAARRPARRRRDDGHRAGAEPRPHRADAARAPASPCARDGRRVTRRQRRRARARASIARARRPVLGGVLHRRGGVLVAGLAARARRTSASTGPAPASCGSLERMGADRPSATSRSPTATSSRRRSRSRDLDVAHGPLAGTVVEAEEVPLAIDELPLVGAARLLRRGRDGRARRRRSCGSRSPTASPPSSTACAASAPTSRRPTDGFAVRGTGGLRGGTIDAHGDHRLAMLGAVAGLASREGVEVVGMEAAAVSYPGFTADLAAPAAHDRAHTARAAGGRAARALRRRSASCASARRTTCSLDRAARDTGARPSTR